MVWHRRAVWAFPSHLAAALAASPLAGPMTNSAKPIGQTLVDDAVRRHGKGEQIERKMIIAAMRKDRKQKISKAWSELARC